VLVPSLAAGLLTSPSTGIPGYQCLDEASMTSYVFRQVSEQILVPVLPA
jgi:hypothetical protein